jgi:hypothetical protein
MIVTSPMRDGRPAGSEKRAVSAERGLYLAGRVVNIGPVSAAESRTETEGAVSR